MRLLIVLSSLAGFLSFNDYAMSAGPAANDQRRPVLVELFTSEGCSSCPPADELLQKLEQTQPAPGAFIIALSEHVDYWDRLGWKDPFSSPIYSRRQEGYGRRFRLDSVYTPQVVVDGAAEAIGSDARQIQAAIEQSIRVNKIQVTISPVFKNPQGVAALHIQVTNSDRSFARADARVMMALAENSVVSHVLRGENSGRTLDHVAVVRSLKDLGHLDSAGALNMEVPLTGDLAQWHGKRIVAFVQEPQLGRIHAIAFRLLPSMAAD